MKHQHKHQNCPMLLRSKGPHIGLYCATHNKWIQWVDKKDVAKIASLGVPVEDTKNTKNLQVV